MKFDMKKPCKECPFIKGSATNITLREGRLDGIVNEISNGSTFTCHKTLDKKSSEQQHCAGAMIYLERDNNPNQMMRIAERIGCYNHKELDMEVDIID